MSHLRLLLRSQRGVAVYLVAVLMSLFMAFIGIAVDLGRGYIIRNALGTAVDGAALAAARMIPQGQSAARAAAERIFNANFPAGFLGVTSLVSPPNVVFSTTADGSSLITVSSSAVMPTSFMRLVPGGSFANLNVGGAGTATRRLVDMAFVIDRSGSLGGAFPQVQTASRNFIALFDQVYDRISLLSFSNNTRVHSAIVQPGRGFALGTIQSQINGLVLGGGTSIAEGLYQGWNQLRLVPNDNQSSLRAIVLFTDGAPNAFAADFPQVAAGCTGTPNVPSGGWIHLPGTLISNDVTPPTATDSEGLWDTYNTVNFDQKALPTTGAGRWSSGNSNNYTQVSPCIPWIPATSFHVPQQGTAAGIPTSFPLYESGLAAQRPLINPSSGMFANHVQNQNNASRNLAEVIANRIRGDGDGQSPIHIFTLGLGNLLNTGTGAGAEQGSAILRRIANDPSSPQFNATQPEGGYFFAGNANELDAAFQAIRDRIIRISQ